MDRLQGLSEDEKATVRALMVPVLGVPDDEALIEQSIHRFDAYVKTIPEKAGTDQVHQLLWLLRFKCAVEFLGKTPERLTPGQMRHFVKNLFDSEGTFFDWVFDTATSLSTKLGGPELPSVLDFAKSIREMLALAYWTNPATDHMTGYVPVWDRSFWDERPDVSRNDRPEPRGYYIDAHAVRRKHDIGRPQRFDRLFRGGAPGRRVAVIGSGAGGAVTAAHLAEKGWDVAVFEAGPRFRPSEYPLDALEGMSVLFEQGLLSLNHNLDIHLLRGRVVGGGTVMTSGMSIKMWPSILRKWNDEYGAGLDEDEVWQAFERVKKRIALDELNTDYTCSPGELWRQGGEKLNEIAEKVIYEFDTPLINVMSKKGQHPHRERIPDLLGDHCFACGLCNYGCHFGHKMSVDLTYLLDAEDAGARIHPNLPIEHLVGRYDHDSGSMHVTGLVLGRGIDEYVEVDHVVLAAGAVGSPALLLRTQEADHTWSLARPFQGRPEDRPVGTGLGFNYGTTVAAMWDHDLPVPGNAGVQINYVGERAGEEGFVLENAFLPPGLLANVVPGVGEDHFHWMRSYTRLGMAVNTSGSPMTGRVLPDRSVRYTVDARKDGELGLIRESLAMIIQQYLYGGASKVGLAGVRRMNDRSNWFTQAHRDWSEKRIVERLEEMIPTAEHLMLSSAHPQGGLRMGTDPHHTAVDPELRLRGTDNLYVADASVFPKTIVVNPQWSVMSIAAVAAPKIERQLRGAS